jgi:hypothetical protein
MCFVMRKVNADEAGRDVHISLPVPASVDRGYHRILGAVKGGTTHHLEVTPEATRL